MGQDFGQWREWNEDRSLDWHLTEPGGAPHGPEPHVRLQRWIATLNQFYAAEPALFEQDCERMGFEWIDASDWEHSVISYIRRASDRRRLPGGGRQLHADSTARLPAWCSRVDGLSRGVEQRRGPIPRQRRA
jgi:1,4-alpha-glucan branching enzyme